MNETSSKKYPEDYPSDAVSILDTMSFTKNVMVLGSMSLRSKQYAGDYDAYEMVKMNEETDDMALDKLVSKFQSNIKALRRMKNVYIGDCKAGVIEEWRVLPRGVSIEGNKVVGYSAKTSRSLVDSLLQSKIITKEEADEAYPLLKKTMSPVDFIMAKKTIKFHIVRWSVPEILHGSKTLRDGRSYSLQQAFNSPSITKLDVIGYVQNSRYTDFSMIYEFKNKGKTLNPDVVDPTKSLREDIVYYQNTNNPFKALKRIFAYAKLRNDTKEIERITPLLNSDLGRLYNVLSDVGTLITLLEEHKNAPLSRIRFEIDQFKGRLANIYTLKSYLKKRHSIIKEIQSAVKSPNILPKLVKLEEDLSNLLSKSTYDLEE